MDASALTWDAGQAGIAALAAGLGALVARRPAGAPVAEVLRAE